MCLALRFATHVPSHQRKEELKAADLGEKRVDIGLRANAAQFHEKLVMTFPKLTDSGGYELLKCLPNSRSLVQLPAPTSGHTPESLRQAVGQARLYIRPLQKDLPLESGGLSQPSLTLEVKYYMCPNLSEWSTVARCNNTF